jgi:hypothetical protein
MGNGGAALSDRRFQIATAIVLISLTVCHVYSAFWGRGLYLDGGYLIYRIAEREWFHFEVPARLVVDGFRQAPIVLLTRFTSVSLFARGQVLTIMMLVTPVILCGLCWIIIPPGKKFWIVFPLGFLLCGMAPTSTFAVGEAIIATAYFWFVLFFLIFRCDSLQSQLSFLILCIPLFWMSEATILLMPALLFVCVTRMRAVIANRARIAFGVSIALIFAITAYQARWIIWPRSPSDFQGVFSSIRNLDMFVYRGQINLPIITASATMLSVALVWVQASAVKPRYISIVFAVFAVLSAGASIFSVYCFTPYGQYHARYVPVFVSIALGAAILYVWKSEFKLNETVQASILSIVLSLGFAQCVAEITATNLWREYLSDFENRLMATRGIISSKSTVHTGDFRRDMIWGLFNDDWVNPILSVVLAKNGEVTSIVGRWDGTPFWPLNPRDPDELPKLKGISFGPYHRFSEM